MTAHTKKSCDESSNWSSLRPGDQLRQPEFHDLYNEMPDDYKAELVGGIVFEPSPLGLDHSDAQTYLTGAFLSYAGQTPGLQTGDNATVILSDEDEVQPDHFLRILPKHGGQSSDVLERNRKSKQKGCKYIQGAPELVAEIAHSSRAIDLHLKKERYRMGGVQEYVVVCLEPQKIYWFDLRNQSELHAADGVLRSSIFPGLWVNESAIFQCDYSRLMETISVGMRTNEYLEFSKKLIA